MDTRGFWWDGGGRAEVSGGKEEAGLTPSVLGDHAVSGSEAALAAP